MVIHKKYRDGCQCVLFPGDCFELFKSIPDESVDLTISSPPYCMGKEYETSTNYEDFISLHEKLIPELVRITKPGGSICWQVGFHVADGVVTPLDYLVYSSFAKSEVISLRNRIIWTFGHGLHCKKRFSGRHETLLWYTKGRDFKFSLDGVRVPQKYPGKMSYKGSKKGQPSGNPNGKNPGDVWEIPVVNASHCEKTEHPCQFPHALVQRLVLSLTKPGDLVVDPFFGSGTTAAAAIIEKRRFIGSEINSEYYAIAKDRCKKAMSGSVIFRPHDRPIDEPNPSSKVAQVPDSFRLGINKKES